MAKSLAFRGSQTQTRGYPWGVIASDDGLDTALARALHTLGRVNLSALQAALAEVRDRRAADPSLSLALLLRERGQVEEDALAAAFALVDEAQVPAHREALSRLGLPRDLGPYRVVRELSRGGMGAVHEIAHEASGVSFALKTILPELGDSGGDELERFAREAVALGQLNHPHVVRVHQARLEGPIPFMIVDLLPGGTLQARLEREPYPCAEALEVIRKLGEGLAHAHERGILHRDLKPLNVLFDDRGEPRLVDFGLTRLLSGSSLTQSGQLLGTPSYMAPEQALGASVDERTDVYGLAGVLFALLTGVPPFRGHGLGVLASVVHDPPPRASKLASGTPPWLDAVLLKALAKDPAQRYPDVPSFLAALAAGIAPPRRRLRLPTWALALVALGCLGLAAGAVLRAGSAYRREEAQRELSQRLRAKGSVLELEPDLERWRAALDPEDPNLLLAEGLVALAQGDREGAAACRARLQGRDPSGARFLEACLTASASEDAALMGPAAVLIGGRAQVLESEAQRGGRFVEPALWSARARARSGDPAQALAAYAECGPAVARAPYAEAALAAATAAAERAAPQDLRALAEHLPRGAAALSRQAEWLEALAERALKQSGRSFEEALAERIRGEGAPPAALQAWVQARAREVLRKARFPQTFKMRPNWELAGAPLLDFRVVGVIPPPQEATDILSRWLLLSRSLDLEDLRPRLKAGCVSILEIPDVRVDLREDLSRTRFAIDYCRTFPEDRERLGAFVKLSVDAFPDSCGLAAPFLDELAALEDEPFRGLLSLWADWVRLHGSPPHSQLQLRAAFQEVTLRRLESRRAWVLRYASDEAQLAALRGDPLVAGVLEREPRLSALYRIALVKAYLQTRRVEEALARAAEIGSGADLLRDGIRGDYGWALYGASLRSELPAAERERYQAALKILLIRVLPNTLQQHSDHGSLLNLAWLTRGNFTPQELPLYDYVVSALGKDGTPHRAWLRAACLALEAGEAEAARARVAELCERLRKAYQEAPERFDLERELTRAVDEPPRALLELERTFSERLASLAPFKTRDPGR